MLNANTFNVLQRFNETPPEELVNEILAHYANSGDVKNTDRLMKKIIFGMFSILLLLSIRFANTNFRCAH